MFVHSDEVKIDPAGRIHTFCHAVNGKWHMMGVTLSAGGSLQWFRNALCQAEMEAAKKAKTDVWAKLNAEAAAVSAGSEGLFFLPYLSGERTPHADADARGSFVGLTLSHGRGHLVRSIMGRGDLLAARCAGDYSRIGRAGEADSCRRRREQSQLWRQIQADIFNQKVVTLNAEEGAAYGVAL